MLLIGLSLFPKSQLHIFKLEKILGSSLLGNRERDKISNLFSIILSQLHVLYQDE